MSSLLTNNSAMNALTTLKSINRELDTTSNRISTGQRVSTSADNAAYWSIATTVRADNKSLGAVKDALGLGAATVDTTYNGMNSIIDDMKELRSKLTTAMAPNVDRSKVQTEIKAIQEKMKATADSSVMSGQNWLSVNSGDVAYKGTQSVVAGFSRDSSGTISFSTVDISVNTIKLYDINGSNGAAATEAKIAAGTALAGTIDFSTETVAFDLDYDGGGAVTITLDAASMASAAADLTAVTTDEFLSALNNQIAASSLNGQVTASYDNQGRLTFQTVAAGAHTLDLTMGAATTVNVGFGAAGATAAGVGTPAVAASTKGILDTNFTGRTYSVSTLDISALTGAAGDLELTEMITNVDKALAAMTNAATKLGSNKTQIEGQSAFVDSLMKANERTIGTLVDADMEEESARLKALQVQQQLGVQSLSIANSSTQNILSLFK